MHFASANFFWSCFAFLPHSPSPTPNNPHIPPTRSSLHLPYLFNRPTRRPDYPPSLGLFNAQKQAPHRPPWPSRNATNSGCKTPRQRTACSHPPQQFNRTLDTHAYKNILLPSHTLISYFRLFCLATYYYLTVHSPSFCHPLPHPPSCSFDTYILTPLSVFMCIGVVLLVCRARCLCTTLYFCAQPLLN